MSKEELKSGYFTHKIQATFTAIKPFYIMWVPIQMNIYSQLKQKLINENKTVDLNTGMIEKAKAFGFGWIGLPDKDGEIEINKEFIAYKHIGEFKKLKDAYKKIMQDYQNIDEMYNLYLTEPEKTNPEENITYILFTLK